MTDICLVTGGAGFIGCALSKGLVARFSKVIAVDDLHPQIHARRESIASLHPAVELVKKDVCDFAALNTILDRWRPVTVIQLSAETGTGQSLTQSSRYVNVEPDGRQRHA